MILIVIIVFSVKLNKNLTKYKTKYYTNLIRLLNFNKTIKKKITMNHNWIKINCLISRKVVKLIINIKYDLFGIKFDKTYKRLILCDQILLNFTSL